MGGLCYLRVLRRRPSVDSQHPGRERIVLSSLITGSIRRRPQQKVNARGSHACMGWRTVWTWSGCGPRSPASLRSRQRTSRANCGSCESILRTMRHHGLGTEEDFLVDIARLRVEHEGAEEIRDWLRVLKDFLVRRNQREKIDLVVIDTMDVLVSMAHLQDVRNELFHFFHFLRSMGVTTYVIANVDPARGGVANDVSFLADGVFELRFSGAGEGRVRLLFRCAKMRHTNHSRDYFVLTYDKGFAARPYDAPKPSRWRRRT